MKYKFNFYTQYNQFYLKDKGVRLDIDSPNFWNEEAFRDRLALGPGILGVGTQSYGEIKGEIELLEKPSPTLNLYLFDHIVEGGIDIRSGELQILDSPNNHLEQSLKIEPGKYRLRIYGSNFASVAETDLANEKDDDYYKIEIWRDGNMERKVLKYYDSRME